MRGTLYTSGKAVRQPSMPWQPWHICTSSRPRLASPAGACACACATPARARAASAAIVVTLFMAVRILDRGAARKVVRDGAGDGKNPAILGATGGRVKRRGAPGRRLGLARRFAGVPAAALPGEVLELAGNALPL